LISYRLARADEVLQEVDLHIKNGLWITAVNRLYYACFYAVTALLVSKGFEARTHAGVRLLLGQQFIKTGIISHKSGKTYNTLFVMRQSGDYDDFVDIKKDDVIGLQDPSKNLIKEIKEIIL